MSRRPASAPVSATWPPISLPDVSALVVRPKRFGAITRADGLHPASTEDRALAAHRFGRGARNCDANGQGVGGVWFAVDPGGELHR